MDCNEHTELTSKIEAVSQIESKLTAGEGGVVRGEQNRKKSHGHRQQCDDYRGGIGRGERVYRNKW